MHVSAMRDHVFSRGFSLLLDRFHIVLSEKTRGHVNAQRVKSQRTDYCEAGDFCKREGKAGKGTLTGTLARFCIFSGTVDRLRH